MGDRQVGRKPRDPCRRQWLQGPRGRQADRERQKDIHGIVRPNLWADNSTFRRAPVVGAQCASEASTKDRHQPIQTDTDRQRQTEIDRQIETDRQRATLVFIFSFFINALPVHLSSQVPGLFLF